MRPSAPDHKIIYVRFHKRVDALLDEFSERTGMKRATAAVWIERRFLERMLSDGRMEDELDEEMLGFTGIEIPYFLLPGRTTDGSMLGRAMRLTVDKRLDRSLELIAMKHDMSTRDFRTAILMQYFEEIGMI